MSGDDAIVPFKIYIVCIHTMYTLSMTGIDKKILWKPFRNARRIIATKAATSIG